ncbi:hypothetical protein FUAX_23300 [Fulvitalea axinellae]|uniref:Outer membrane protein beta-barrel domain-containing protein n=1 Tax=Fulvitalea axinellae TaxID=1182444 RepID=A0AAU9CIK6_9BACT|nr:hypothetical protein FUAX_23300 [Fulvitalea axinellae]
MRKLIKYIGALVMVLAVSPVFAQQQQTGLMGISYNMASPTGNTNDFVSDMSFRGVTFDGRYFVHPRVSVGLSFGWNGFDEFVEDGRIEYDNGIVEGNQYREIEAIPIMVTGHYYFDTYEFIRPYVGLGVGAVSLERSFDMSLKTYGDDSWHFGLTPEAGFIIPIGYQGFGIMANAKYNYMAGAKDVDSQGYWNFGVGVVVNLFD